MRKIFVFGSNLAGHHGAGSARAAMEKHGACYHVGVGLCGDSYAIPTKDCDIKSLPLAVINCYVAQFLQFARLFPDWQFDVVAIGCGLAGFSPQQIAPMFKECPVNCRLPSEFIAMLGDKA